jgi:predicted enzyme related to lactoylglutathione lyase
MDQESRSAGHQSARSLFIIDDVAVQGDDRPNPEVTTMSPTIRSLVIPVSDLDATKAVYTALLGTPHTDEAYYVGYNVNGFEVALNPGAVGGPVAFADVDDLDATRATLLAAGATERDEPRQVAPGARVCVLADADGNPIGLRGK